MRWIRAEPQRGLGVRPPLQGECFKMHGDLFWFNHLHIIPSSYDLGNVLTDQIRTWDIFNGHKVDKQFSAVTEDGADGIVRTGQPADSPNLIGPLGTITVQADISTVGPVTILYTSIYDFVTGEQLTMTITGNRVVIMSTEPQYNIDEKWAYFTDIITSASGKEQRISPRDRGRQRFVYRFIKEYGDLSWLENQLWAWSGNNWGLPLWTDYTRTTADITQDVDLVVPVEDTTNRDFRATDTDNVHLCLLWLDERTFEAIEVISFTDTTITTLNPVLQSWPEGTYVLPLRTARMPKGHNWRNPNFGARALEVEWHIIKPNDNRADALIDSPPRRHRGDPVWDYETYPLITGGQYGVSEDRSIVAFGDDLGRFTTFSDNKFPQNRVTGFHIESFGRQEFIALRAYLDFLRGRWKAIWVSTQMPDFEIENHTAAPSTTLNVLDVNYTRLIWNSADGPKTRQDIEIRYVDGTSDFRQIVNATVIEGVREVLTINEGISQDTDQVDRISWLIRRRLSSDQVTYKHTWYENEMQTSGLGFTDIVDDDI